MWNALRTDLTEFVSTVTGETAEALNQMDANFPEQGSTDDEKPTPAEAEALRRMGLEETYTTPLLEPDLEDSAEETADSKEATTGDKTDEIEEESKGEGAAEDKSEPPPPKDQEEKQSGETEQDPDTTIDEDGESNDEYETGVKDFIASFSCDSKTDEISELLDLYPESLKAHFENLVPTTVTYEEFWMRYFYRCDAARIQAEWDAEEEAIQQARAQAVKQGLSTVRNLLGGAVKAVSSTLGDESGGPGSSAKAGSRYFGSAGRPPFVMNTAVSEDDFDGEEEEELGWDEDSDDEDNFGSNENTRSEDFETEQIEFKDPATEKLQEDLQQALAERDVLQQTIDLQKKEIAALKEGKADNVELQQLKTKLFEKESELVAIRANLSDVSHGQEGQEQNQEVAGLEGEILAMSEKLRTAQSALSDAVSRYEASQSEMQLVKSKLSQQEKGLGDEISKNKDMARVIEDLKRKLAAVESDNATIQKALEASKSQENETQSVLSEKIALQAELDKSKAALAASEEEKVQLQTELENTKEMLRLKEEALSVDSPDTGIKIEPPVIEKLDEEGAVEDGWDDDW